MDSIYFFAELAIFYVLLTASQFAYTVIRDAEQMRRSREHSEKLIEAQQSIAKEALEGAFKQGYQAAMTVFKTKETK